MALAVFVLGTMLLLAGAAAGTALLRPDSWLDASITCGVLAAAEVAALIGVAGAFGSLRRDVVLGAAGAWAAATVAAAVLTRPPVALRRPSAKRALATLRGRPWEAAIVGLAALALAWQAFVALVLPPYAFDALTYHLTTVATWLQQENVAPTPLSLCCARYPANAELLFAWPPLLLGSDALVDTVQIGFALLGALAVAGLARAGGFGDPVAAVAAALFLVTPVVLTQAPTNYADVLLGGCALAALYAIVRFAATAEPRRLLPAALATGLLLGTKGTGVVWAAVLLVTAGAVLAIAARRGRIGLRSAALAASGFLAVCLLFGAPWYVRNWVDTGNPVYPFHVAPAGITLFEGPTRVEDVLTEPEAGKDAPLPVAVLRSWAADLDFWRQGSYDYQQRLGGLGPLWAWLGLPLLVPFTVLLVRRRNPLVLAVLVVAAVFLLQPYRWWSRFTIPPVALAAIAIAAAGFLAPRAWMRHTVRATALVLALAGVVLSSYEIDPSSRAEPLASSRLLRLALEPADERTIGRLFFPEYRFLERVPPDATVVVDLRAEAIRFVYPLFGPRLERRVLRADGTRLPPADAWVVTAAGRPLDARLQASPAFTLAADVGGVRAWRPEP